jgi:hypothetical protein
MQNPPTMKTGFSNLIEKETCPPELAIKIESILMDMMEKAVLLGVSYSQASGRNNLSSTDILYALQYQAHEYCSEDNILNQFETDVEEAEEEEEDYESDDGYETDDDDFMETEDDEGDLELFSRSKNIDEVTTKMNEYHDDWSTWEPVSIIQRILKTSIDDKFSHLQNTH